MLDIYHPNTALGTDREKTFSKIKSHFSVNKLPNVVMDHLVEKDGWTHLDYAVAMDADYLVYDYVLDVFSRF